MIVPPFSRIEASLSSTDRHDLPSLKISVCRNVMLEAIEPYLRHFALQLGFDATIRFGRYDSIVQEAVGTTSLLDTTTDCVLIFMNISVLSPQLARNFTVLDDQQVGSEAKRIEDLVAMVLNGIRRQTDALILWHGFEVTTYPAFGIRDSQVSTGQSATLQALNGKCRDIVQGLHNAYFVDLDQCLRRTGADHFYDRRYWHIGRAPYTLEALSQIAFEDFRFVRAVKGKNKKCLVLDCDNTLWGGILGESGLAGIKLGKTHPGSAYMEFQEEVLNRHNRGVILALCTKNEEQAVWRVFEEHPDMVLKRHHIAAAQINWRDKATNLAQIALDLNIGLDSMVFADDSEFEVNLIRQELPQVEVIHLPEDGSVDYRNILSTCGLFDTLTFSKEDRMRGAMYKAQIDRRQLKAEASDLETYYRSLDMTVCVGLADEFAVPRIAQLTQRSNQFNLTTRRHTEKDIACTANASDSDVLHISLSDKFGDSGIVGICILKYAGEEATIDTFVLSCRALGRGVEDVLLAQALGHSKKRGCSRVVGNYYRSARNKQVESFYSDHGFAETSASPDRDSCKFSFDLARPITFATSHFKEIVNCILNEET